MSHGHDHGISDLGERRLIIAIFANGLLTGAQIIGGILSGSLALIADAVHNLNDAASLAIALAARRIARRPADHIRTFGYRRAETVGALISVTALIIIGLYLVYEAVLRWFNPKEIDGWTVILVALAALVVDSFTAFLTWGPSRHSLNMKAAFIHNLSDALGSLAVIVSGAMILWLGWHLTDLMVTLLIAGYVLYQSLSILRQSIHVLMESVPVSMELDDVIGQVRSIEDVLDVHHVHVWQIDERHWALEAHIVVAADAYPAMEAVKQRVKHVLADQFDIHHSTLEFEARQEGNHTCPHPHEHPGHTIPEN